MQCILCENIDDTVETVATCADRCTITAHPACFVRRKPPLHGENKHHGRSNGHPKSASHPVAFHVCASCADRREPDASQRTSRCEIAVRRSNDRPENPRSFLRRDGTPCLREAVENGACRLHRRDAEVMHRMMAHTMSDSLRSPTIERIVPQDAPSDAVSQDAPLDGVSQDAPSMLSPRRSSGRCLPGRSLGCCLPGRSSGCCPPGRSLGCCLPGRSLGCCLPGRSSDGVPQDAPPMSPWRPRGTSRRKR